MLRRTLAALREALRRYFVAGLLLFAPIAITLWAIVRIVQYLDNLVLPRLLKLVVPGRYEAPSIPVVGALFTLALIVLLGVIARHFFGAELVRVWERLLRRVPVARTIYSALKQLFEAVFQASAEAHFNRVMLIEFPRAGLYALAFTTGAPRLVQQASEEPLVSCFVPKTPNPTTGFYLLVPESQLIEVDLSVEDAFKLVISGGLVQPPPVATPR